MDEQEYNKRVGEILDGKTPYELRLMIFFLRVFSIKEGIIYSLRRAWEQFSSIVGSAMGAIK